MDMIGLMHEAEPYGRLLVNGKAPTTKQLAAILGDAVRDVEKWLAELADAGVFSRAEDGTIYSRRMQRDADRSEEGRSWIEKRWKDREPTQQPNSPPNRVAISEIDANPITQRLEARDQRPENLKYRFAGKTIRLTGADFDSWRAAYSAIPDLDAELRRIDDSDLPKNWFPAVSAKLAAKHQKILGERKTRPEGGVTPLGVGG